MRTVVAERRAIAHAIDFFFETSVMQPQFQRICTLLSFVALGSDSCVSTGHNTYDLIASDYRALVTRREASGVDEHALTGDQLDRATLIRAVLQQNQTLESARNAWSAALARYREAGAVDDPMVRIAVAPMSVGSSAARFGYEVEATQR
ncbi:MAG TPA: hypothetical protein VHZ95_05250, partial [Polyangiales bacterium]|nr:hypothetical protein [Polyangiales bacterium]